ncbi:hypothetical protein AKJ44_01935 [candidate division MSBL1 archaeon SCGC-AAA261F17]|uniref:Radical SAM core domain-containing protein n=1 Tax=candidate division MSBL1 archaeon SCGC-AAA261F17 TaxID=1698274 RepID=A0A133V641_9EURY|nr:hypothetical protein AKJ44_01935 [candidate division MSBL1 archaeon SCGC-AAA261F17]
MMGIRLTGDGSKGKGDQGSCRETVGDVVARQENFGGIVFDQRNGLMLELDREAFFFLLNYDKTSNYSEMLRLLEREFRRSFSLGELWRLSKKLFGLGIMSTSLSSQSKEFSESNWPKTEYLSAPETVHLAVTYRCNLECSCCYVEGGDCSEDEMSLGQIRRLVDKLSELRVFQIAIGGGEPFLRSDLPEIVDVIRRRGIIPNITTNGTLLTRTTLEEIADEIGRLKISFESGDISKKIEPVNSAGVPFGINLILTRENIARIEDILSLCSRLGAKDVTLLRPKPSSRDLEWWRAHRPQPAEYVRLGEKLVKLANKFGDIQITVDCALSFLMKGVSLTVLTYHGVYGCSAGERFLFIAPNADVYPCSQFTDTDHLIGNALKEDFADLWNESPVLTKFRKFRENDAFSKTSCGKCRNVINCGGCRVITRENQGDFYGRDPACSQGVRRG